MSTPALSEASIPTVQGLAPNMHIQGGSLKQLGGTLIGAVTTFQGLVLRIQNIVQMIFAELLGRLSSIMNCFQSFSVCMEKLEEAFCPKPVASPDLGTSVKQMLASLNAAAAPASRVEPSVT